MAATRRGFLGWLAAAVTAAPTISLPAWGSPKPLARSSRYLRDISTIRDKNILLTMQDYTGLPEVRFRNIPIRVVDKLL